MNFDEWAKWEAECRGDRLKPCPFCGGEAEIDTVDAGQPNEGGFFAACLKCGASTNVRFACGEDPVQLVREQWNRRSQGSEGLRLAELEEEVQRDPQDGQWPSA